MDSQFVNHARAHDPDKTSDVAESEATSVPTLRRHDGYLEARAAAPTRNEPR
jgi:hypothetical protein